MYNNVKLISITPDAERTIGYCSRVSNPANQDNPEVAGLIKYCIKNKHWSIFEQAFMTLEIKTTRAIGRQILRHRSFTFQEFSQRYAPVPLILYPTPRRQDYKNRQNSIDDIPDEDYNWFMQEYERIIDDILVFYQTALERGIAKESARFILPESAESILYMSGSIRSWIHYLELRTGNGTQKEHIEVANECKTIFIEQLPNISKALGWIS